MRIGLFADRLARRMTTGVGAYVAGVSRALATHDAGHRYLLFSTRERGQAAEEIYGRVPVAWLRWPRRPVHAAWIAADRPRVNSLEGELDLVHVLVPSVPFATDRPLVVTVHDLGPLTCPQFFRPRDRWLFHASIRRLAARAAHVVADSAFSRGEVIEHLGVSPAQVTVVHPGLPPRSEGPGADGPARLERLGLSDVPFVLFVGELTPRKSPALLVEAFGRVARSLPEHRLVLAGSPGLASAAVAERIERLRLGKRVCVLGHVSQEDLHALMGAAQTLVLPSRHEGFGFPVLEAMTAGTPVVVSDRGSLPELAGDAALVVPEPSPSGFADAILALAESNALRARLVRLGHARLARFSWERAAAGLVAVYEQVAKGAPARAT